ncbi:MULTISPECIES: arginase family protein [unclassified Undibacterium]|uniref:arginase family protein n=1 Tax=unclassified Undibacterium TaxID=2630295 RepID=UPI002AC8E0F7|nr:MULTISPECIES: arginase family protein [unclassified Undibacterium]MEB0137681.1 arginase family protein [Undibacterium sp. CCC2.1]MEB0172667.1 arginase family protein [Undibacterium sp. CCC1.1]MEB0177600.1 arginase family protein [Undibacterium sp. CCC3.4]MEB0215462.1 arginase family protein [Undibacterium sp. 5I2]WPX42255.1 arginase family protein [Undibacterium sp. CCC3.4]
MTLDSINYRVHPRLRWESIGNGRIEISLPFGGKRLRAADRIATLLDGIAAAQPQTSDVLIHCLGLSVFDMLVKYLFLLPDKLVDLLGGGLCTPAARPAGCALAVHDLDTLIDDDLVVLHVPIATTTEGSVSVAGGGRRVRAHLAQSIESPLGTSERRGILLDLDFACQLDTAALRLFDVGDVIHQPLQDRGSEIGERAAHICRMIVDRGARPLILGGDHALAYYSIGALAQRYPRLGVLQFDAHPDLYAVGAPCDEQLNHANVMHWVRQMPHVQALWQVGVRDFFHQPIERVACLRDPKLQVLSAFEAETKGYQRLLDGMDPSLPWFVTFDVDALALADCPETATPVLGGLSFYPLLACFERLFREFRIIGMEFVEIGDATQGAHGTAAVAARLASRYLFHLRHAQSTEHMLYSPIV